MAKKKIIAYYLNEAEKNYILKFVEEKDQTDVFIIGEINSNDEKGLSEFGIIYKQLGRDIPAVPNEIKISKNLGFYKTSLDPDSIFDTEPPKAFFGEGYYLIRILGPILKDYRDMLGEAGVNILEFRPPDGYIVRIDRATTYRRLNALDFIEDVKLITGNDTPLDFLDRSNKDIEYTGKTEAKMLRYDMLLFNESDLEGFLEFLNQHNIPIAGASGKRVGIYLMEGDLFLSEIRKYPAVREMSEYIPPRLHNDHTRTLVGLERPAPFPADFPYQGEGQVIGIADSGIDQGHRDFSGRITGIRNFGGATAGTDQNGHGTHVAGTVLGSGAGSGGQYRGAAPKSKLYFQSLMDIHGKLELPFSLKDVFIDAYNNGVRIHNNSWGSSTSSKVNTQAIEVDEFVHEHRDMLLVFSAGNDGTSAGVRNVPLGQVDLFSISAPGTAKNILTVGASRSARTKWGYAKETYNSMWPDKYPDPPYYTVETVSGNVDCLAAFSSRGPTDDDRFKPDIVAPGTDIVSAKSAQSSPSNFWAAHPISKEYAIMGGTSMAAPLVSGCAAVIREFYQKKHNHIPSAALLKATIINGARKLTGADAFLLHANAPNFNQGFGMIDMANTIPTENNRFFVYFADNYNQKYQHFDQSGMSHVLTVTTHEDGWLKACLAYTDAPSRALQNNLNLVIDAPDKTRWIGNETGHSMFRGFDAKNNVETIIITNAIAGNYTLTVLADNIVKGAQDYALVITAADQKTTII